MATPKGSRRAAAPGDDSHLDERYFVDPHVYNCPFCKRRHVAYYVEAYHNFLWTATKSCYAYFVRCQSCSKVSMHLSYAHVTLVLVGTGNVSGTQRYRFQLTKGVDLDSLFFYSVPSSFFALDERIPRVIRELFAEAEGCLKSNFLTGASACVRKAIYELAVLQQAPGENYDEQIKALKGLNPGVAGDFFDTLLTIQQLTSSKVHEKAHDRWEAKHLRVILATVMEILKEIFVVPDERQRRREFILEMKQELTNERLPTATTEPEKVEPAEAPAGIENGEPKEQLASTAPDDSAT